MGMQITLKSNKIYFKDLNVGDTFLELGRISLRIEEIRLPSSEYIFFNTVDLQTGRVIRVKDFDLVTPIKLKAEEI